jgi:hypothetical protein
MFSDQLSTYSQATTSKPEIVLEMSDCAVNVFCGTTVPSPAAEVGRHDVLQAFSSFFKLNSQNLTRRVPNERAANKGTAINFTSEAS